MVRSVRSFLVFNLLVATILAAFVLAALSLGLVYKDLRGYFDDRLEEMALILESFALGGDMKQLSMRYDKQAVITSLRKVAANLGSHCILPQQAMNLAIGRPLLKQLKFQVWDATGKLILYSENFPFKSSYADKPGFSNRFSDGRLWRVLTVKDVSNSIVINVAETYMVGYDLQKQTIKDLIIIMMIVFSILVFASMTIINKALYSIFQVATEVRKRVVNQLRPVDTENVPREIKPLMHELNKLFAKLEATLEREKRFAADAAHELKTPLAALKTQTQVALNAQNESDRRKAMDNIIKCVDRGTHTVQQLLILSRILPDSLYKKPELVDLNKEANKTIAELFFEAKSKDIEIELIAPDKSQIILGNSVAIDILIRNLVDNAIKYTHAKGWVKVVVEEKEHNIILKVIDNGPGIPAELRTRVFERFFRIVGAQSAGSGLGLSIVEQIARFHGADVKVTTPESGQGLEVRVTFNKDATF